MKDRKHHSLQLLAWGLVGFLSVVAEVYAQTLPSEVMDARYRIQVVAISDQKSMEAAEQFAQHYSTQFGMRAYVIHKEAWYKVLLGDFSDRQQVRAALKAIKKQVNDAWPVAPDTDKVISIWENGRPLKFTRSFPPAAPTFTPVPTPTRLRPLAAASPEIPEGNGSPPPEVIRETLIPPDEHSITPPVLSLPISTEMLVNISERGKTGAPPVPGVKEGDLLPGSEQTAIVSTPILLPTPEPTPTIREEQAIMEPEAELRQEEQRGSLDHSPEEQSTAIEQPTAIRIDDLDLDAVFESPHVNLETELPIMVVSPDGKFLLTSSREKVLYLWDRESGVKVHTFVGHIYPLVSAGFSPNGRYVISAANDGTLGEIRLWNQETGEEISTFRKDIPMVGRVGFSADGQYAYYEVTGERVWWEIKTGKQIHDAQLTPAPQTVPPR